MVSSEHRDWLYIAIPIYFVMLAASAAWAYRRMEKMNSAGVSDKLSSHYLGGRSFGPLLTAGTVFASLFSGYTVVGIPNEAYRLGWYALRWLPTSAMLGFSFYGTGLRLRKASLVRNHQSPVDLITDRYQSQFLRYTIVAIQITTSVIYLAAQVISLKGTFNSMFGIETNANWPVITIMAIILVFEWLGGLSSVALTDGIQAGIMLLSFMILPIIMKIHFGGWTDLDPETYPKPSFYETPSRDAQWQFWQFSMINFSFFTLPHFLQRTYAAKDLVSLKTAYSAIVVGPWVTIFVGVFIGTVGVQMLDGAEVASPFASILEEVMNLGGFSKFTAVIAFTASLAAIMSTADSILIAISQLVTVEGLYTLVKSKNPSIIAWMGRGVSFVAAALALVVGIFWNEGISDLAAIQFPVAMQGVPAWLFALFATSKATDVHPWCMAIAAWVAVVYVFSVYFGYLKENADALPIDAGITGAALQVGVLIGLESTRRLMFPDKDEQLTESTSVSKSEEEEESPSQQLYYPNRPTWDISCTKRFGDRPLTPDMLWKMMHGVHEPITNIYFVSFMILTVTMVTPLVPAGIPTSIEDAVAVNGLPWWAFKAIILCAIPYLMGLHAIWRMPNQFPSIEEEVVALLEQTRQQQESLMDPDLAELSREEMGSRTSYDETNQRASLRRSSIRKSLQRELAELASADFSTAESVKRLSAFLHPTGATPETAEGDDSDSANDDNKAGPEFAV